MTGAWSNSPFGGIVKRVEIGPLGKSLGEHNGESRRVCRLQKHPDWVFKEYRSPVSAIEIQRLDRLIGCPEQMNAADKALVDGHTSWPVTRVTDSQQRTVGVVMPLAPDGFSATRQMPSGRSERKPLEVDVLALTEERQAQIKIPAQSLRNRLSVCASIAAVGALFERNNLVYLDWSYANVFWGLADYSAYVIDLDGCSFGMRQQIETPNWGDPLVPRGSPAGNESDRYRVALLVGRCLTGMRTNLAETRSGISRLRSQGGAIGDVAQLLLDTLDAQSIANRSSIVSLSSALDAAKGLAPHAGYPRPSRPSAGGVRQWKPVVPRGPAVPPPAKSVPVASRAGTSQAYRPPSPRARPSPPSPPSPSYTGLIVGVIVIILVIVVLIVTL